MVEARDDEPHLPVIDQLNIRARGLIQSQPQLGPASTALAAGDSNREARVFLAETREPSARAVWLPASRSIT